MLRRLRALLGRPREAPERASPPPRRAPLPTAPSSGGPPTPSGVDPVLAALAYHERTKHHPGRWASALPFMDWDTQPDPFRRYDGAPLVPLDHLPAGPEPRYEPAFLVGGVPTRPVDRASISQLFQDALGLSAWKRAGDATWALRMNPSSGNLHPTEGYALLPAIPGLDEGPAVWHYRPDVHGLERRLRLSEAGWRDLMDGLPEGAVLVGLSAIVLRESWKYGERAYRYTCHDAGHAIAAITLAAAGLGWDCRLLDGALDAELELLLGTASQQGPEAERAEALLALFPASGSPGELGDWRVAPSTLAELRGAAPEGLPRPLAPDHHPWPILEAVALATRQERPAAPEPTGRTPNPCLEIGDSALSLRAIVHQRRSAVEMDGRTGITAAAFYQMLIKTLPGRDQVPFQALPWRARVHLGLWVHRVVGLAPGLYLLVRDPDATEGLWAALSPDHARTHPAGCPEGLPLYLLAEGDRRAEAAGASCGQAIAADGCFAVSMLAPLRASLERRGAPFYRRLHWEAGALGQVLYLEAEASGVRATGIGCFFDDAARRAFGASEALAPIYHFTVGGPVEDTRLQSLPPYPHPGSA